MSCRRVEATPLGEGPGGNAGFDEAEPAGLTWEEPLLECFEQVRQAIVGSLLEEVAAVAREEGCPIDCNSGLLARPSARAWTEGSPLRDRGAVARHVYLQAHFPRLEQSRQDLAWAATVVPPGQVVLATMMSQENIGSARDLYNRVEIAAAMGAGGVSS